MASEPSPAFQFYAKDVLSDANLLQLSLEAKGAYLMLMSHCWVSGCLPEDPKKIAALAGCSPKRFLKLWPELISCFHQRADGHFVDPRTEREREKQAQFRESQRIKGRASAEARLRSGSTPVEAESQPDGNSSSSSSSSFASSSASAQTKNRKREPVALAGTLPRDFRHMAWTSARGKHVPSFLHEEFKLAVGGTPESADQQLRAFYEAVEAGWPDGSIGDDPVRLWRKEFAAKFPSVAPASRPQNSGLSRVTESALRALQEARE